MKLSRRAGFPGTSRASTSIVSWVIDCEITDEISDFILEPVDEFPVGAILSRSFNKSGTRGKLCLMNPTPRAHIFGRVSP